MPSLGKVAVKSSVFDAVSKVAPPSFDSSIACP